MKRQFEVVFCLLIMVALPALSFAADHLKGDTLYAKGQYKAAAASYQSVADQGYQSAGLFYNLGNAYFKCGEIPSALLYYKKAHLLSPGDEDINFNIRVANSKTVDKIEEAPEFFLSRWWTELILSFSANMLAVSSIVLTLLASGLLILYFFSLRISIKKAAFFGSAAFFIVALFTILIAHSQSTYFNDNKQGIIFTSVVNVKSSPTGKSATVFVLHDGTKVNVKETNGGWIRIKLVNGNEGWIKTTDIKDI